MLDGRNIAIGPELRAFQQEVRDFCTNEFPRQILDRVSLNQKIGKADYVLWQKKLQSRKWMTGHWPEEHGGLGWGRLQRWLFEQEIYAAGAPWLIPFGVSYVGPVIYTFGNDAQKKRFLPAIASSDEWWAQGYSEPNAGSDLASVTTSAVLQGDEYVVNGQKTWTTMAQYADWMFTLVRTSRETKPQQGLSFLLIDMKSPGVEVRPIATIDGYRHVNEVFLDAVRVPVANRIGDEGGGWSYAKFLLVNERLLAGEVSKCRRLLGQLRALARQIRSGGRPLWEDRAWRARYRDLDVQIVALESLCIDLLLQAEGGRDPGSIASAIKLIGARLLQKVSEATMAALGQQGLAYQQDSLEPGWDGSLVAPPEAAGAVREYLYGRATTIYGGSDEVQRNILAQVLIGR
jgi:alkylation response protein AidB-like acyl-CoA dehydrogenase